MQTYIVHWQFPDQESHIQGAEAFAVFVEGGCEGDEFDGFKVCLLYTSPSPRDDPLSRMPSSA